MFIVSPENQSEELLAELCHIEEEIFTELGLHYRVLVIFQAGIGSMGLLSIPASPFHSWRMGLNAEFKSGLSKGIF